MSLYVDIEKHFPEFCLKTKFEAGNEVLSILGASGCGKSLTLKCIAGIETPDRGRIVLDGRVLYDSGRRINLPTRERNIGYLFQNYALFPHMTVKENIACGLDPKNTKDISSWIEKFYLTGLEDHYPAQLSGGQQQRTALARMLASGPSLIMLDEPFSALDDYLKWQLEQELRSTIRDFPGTALFVSHNRDEVYRMSDRIAVMGDGRLKTVQAKKDLFQNPESLEAAFLTGCKNMTHAEYVDDHSFFASDWNITLHSEIPVPKDIQYAGFRAHYFTVVPDGSLPNTMECTITEIIEDTFSMIILFRECSNQKAGDWTNLRFELPKSTWKEQKIKNTDTLFLRFPENQFLLLR
ncbi:sulfate/molybdate ABC transporter ATP-binding protein [Anaerostipes sp.]|uniref:sulfate/molybdate ABC transporter ATP-binding protein n=1 Tax=Anaerostipes sp. TaxID=1872530 RepID=UPI0025BE4971|nr:ATP-binding cassette domain-containing protein [Anaerostipes sp.]MBS7007751.1 ATP-binding cassette domain-containing protein [Anaerostipes sp.]